MGTSRTSSAHVRAASEMRRMATLAPGDIDEYEPFAAQGEGVICPTGALSKILSSGPDKNISLHSLVETSLWIDTSRLSERGVSRSSRTLGRDAVDAATSCARGDRRAGDEPVSGPQRADERRCCVRRSRVVLTPRRWRQVRGCCVGPTGRGHNVGSRATVAKEPGHRGELEISRKTIACGNAG
jgi:hypothetical protein